MTKQPVLTGLIFLFCLATGCAEQQVQSTLVAPVAANHFEHSAKAKLVKSEQPEIIIQPREQKQPDTLTNHEKIWPRLRQGMALQGHSHPRLDKQLAWYANNQSYIDRVLERGNRYLFHIVNELEKQKMPLELALLPVVESAFDPFAYSHSHAAGLWQFIPGTGKRFGLEKNWWYDGRRDPVASTEAAIKYLGYLHKYFDGDWLLALAAYNSGEGNVRRAIARNKKLGRPTDFWSLKLPKETQAYVPQLLAVAAIVRTPEKYHTVLPEVANKPYFERIELDEQADLSSIARMAGIDTEEIYKLNAGFNRWVTQPNGSHSLYLPVQSVPQFRQALAEMPKSQWVAIQEYVVKPGDNLSTIASRHGVSVKQLKQTNRLNSHILQIGQRLQLPGTGLARPLSAATASHKVKPGESLWKIARQHNVSVFNLKKWNSLNGSSILQPGQTLNLQSEHLPELREKKVRYRVRSGDSLHRIANKFDLDVAEIVRWNKLNPKRYLQPGQRLTLFVDIANI